jgi:hypothetical protein
MEKLVIIPVDTDPKFEWHLHAEDCQDVKRSYDFSSLNSVWTVSSIADARDTLQNDWTAYEENENEIYDFDRNVKVFPCSNKLERVGA